MFKNILNPKEIRSLGVFILVLGLLAGFYLYSEMRGLYFFSTSTEKWSPAGSGQHVHHK